MNPVTELNLNTLLWTVSCTRSTRRTWTCMIQMFVINWYALIIGPHGHVVVQVVRQMVWHQVFSRDTGIHWVPVLKLSPQSLQMLLRDVRLGKRSWFEEDEIPHLSGHLFWSRKRDTALSMVFQIFLSHTSAEYKLREIKTLEKKTYLIPRGEGPCPLRTPPCSRWATV